MNKLSNKNIALISIIVLLIFIVSATIFSVFLLLKSEKISQDAILIKKASYEISSVAETLKVSNGDLLKTKAHLTSHQAFDFTDDILRLYYDSNFKPTSRANCEYEVKINKTTENAYHEYTFSVYNQKVLEASEKNKNTNVKKNISSLEEDKIYSFSFRTPKIGGV